MTSRIIAAAAFALLAASPSHGQRFSNSTLGISIEKPQHWQILTAAENAENLKKADFGTAEMKEAVQKYATAPLYAFIKYPEPFADVNPSVKINTRPAGDFAGRTGKDVLEAILPGLSGAMADFKLVTPPETVSIDGHSAGHMSVAYTLKAGGEAYPAQSEMWVVPRGDHLVIVGAGYPQKEEMGIREELMGIINSIALSE